MGKTKMLAYVLAMLFIGAVYFSGLGALVNWRMGSPLASMPAEQTAIQPSSSPLAVLKGGVRQSLLIAQRELEQHNRTQAVIALDAAKRAAEVGRHAAAGELAETFHYVYRQTEQARARLQDGNPGRAEQILAVTAGSLASTQDGGGSRKSTVPESLPLLRKYEGAHVLNAHGVRIGQVAEVRGPNLKLEIGGNHDVLGFIDLGGGKEVLVSAGQLVFGKLKGLGSTMVVLPVFAATPVSVEAELRVPQTAPIVAPIRQESASTPPY